MKWLITFAKNTIMKKIFLIAAVFGLVSCAELLHVANEVAKSQQNIITDLDIANGLKEALNYGIEKEVKKLTVTDGFLGNTAVKIPFPEEVTKIESTLRGIGLGVLPDEGLKLINRAAEDAVKEATPIFLSAIKNMSFADARKILMSHDSSATQYLEGSTRDSLYSKFYPVMENSFGKVGADKAWNSMITKYNMIPFITKTNPDIKDYVTNKALNGVFKMVTVEEKKIRYDIQERTSDLLKRVFALQDKK